MFTAHCLPILIGSLPLTDHHAAMRLIEEHSPAIPLWPQLPKLPGEGMVRQFLSGFPGLQEKGDRFWIDTSCKDFEEQMTAFYEDYMGIEERGSFPENSRFCLGDDTASGFAVFLDSMNGFDGHTTLKGQITGPVTIGISVRDDQNRSIFYDDNLRDMLVKHLTFKARWQIEQLKPLTTGAPPIIFIDEPGIVSYGSSAFVGITQEMVADAVAEVIAGIHEAGGLAGVHICANGDWGPVLSSDTDIISFDAYFYFDNFTLYRELLCSYLQRGGMLAWGIVPTGDAEVLGAENAQALFDKWQNQLKRLSTFSLPVEKLHEQTFIAPSCGTGSLPAELAVKVLRLTSEVSKLARAAAGFDS